jgi:hypothetical protein
VITSSVNGQPAEELPHTYVIGQRQRSGSKVKVTGGLYLRHSTNAVPLIFVPCAVSNAS